jgi:hypothetical protein
LFEGGQCEVDPLVYQYRTHPRDSASKRETGECILGQWNIEDAVEPVPGLESDGRSEDPFRVRNPQTHHIDLRALFETLVERLTYRISI